MAGRNHLTFDLRERPQLLELLRVLAARENKTQKAILIEALEAYFSHRQESFQLLKAADRAFAEWENPEDQVYDTL